MITFFPNFYPDELVYSLLSRYYSKSGYSAYIFAAEDLYENKLVKPDNQEKIVSSYSYVIVVSHFVRKSYNRVNPILLSAHIVCWKNHI